jgi:putative acetyltransferase
MKNSQNQNFEIQKYSSKYQASIIGVWEKSVLSTHHFLSEEDFLSIKSMVKSIDFNVFDVYLLIKKDTVIGFIGVDNIKVEMLFLDPKYFGQGWGSYLMKFAIKELKVNQVDVNEQNSKAVNFYKKIGFETYERVDKDDQGKNYPLLRMKLTDQIKNFNIT